MPKYSHFDNVIFCLLQNEIQKGASWREAKKNKGFTRNEPRRFG
jgi:hypothetical protein